MAHKQDYLTAGLWIGFTVLAAGALVWNGAEALAGRARFAVWHLPTLIAGMYLSWNCLPETGQQRILAFIRISRKRLYRHSRLAVQSARRAAHSLAALFTFRPFNRPQTEP